MEQRETIIVLDYCSQYTQLIARRVREQHVYCHIYPWNAAEERVMAHQPMGFILSGGPNSVYEPGAPTLPRYITQAGVPILPLAVLGTRDALIKHDWRFGYSRAEVRVLDPIPTEGLTKADIPDLRDRTRAVVAETLDAMRAERAASAAG